MPMLRVLPWALCAALALFSFATYGSLPESIPQHFDAAGNVTSATARSPWSWAAIPIIAVVTQLALAALSAALVRRPHLFNFPEKERFLKIPAAYQGPVINRMREMLDLASAFMVLVFAVVQFMIWRAALGHSTEGLSIGLVVGPIMVTPGLLIMISRVNGAVDEAERLWKANDREKSAR